MTENRTEYICPICKTTYTDVEEVYKCTKACRDEFVKKNNELEKLNNELESVINSINYNSEVIQELNAKKYGILAKIEKLENGKVSKDSNTTKPFKIDESRQESIDENFKSVVEVLLGI